ncbi:cell division ATPase MinD [Candidatus Nanohalococcus occultus]|uniref:FleN family ATPase involved in flagellar biosynthesis n=1 Tax=Candidatus Nanohalococcus occultus TaxID=2978047 RepID=A0ABY8CD54_9ARCH|nr:FleN family ATPase involved in flagellar biosynthesis [Candidatus Nanohaloarchaeota archaeon SVXNc]
MTRLVCVASGKGGTGKTTVTSNLGAALTQFGTDTIVLDANLTNPNLGFHLGIPLYPKTLHDVLKGDAHITEAMYIHNSGLRVVPAGLSIDDLIDTSPDNLSDVLLDAVGEPDFVLVDSAAGLGNESISAIEASDEVLIVTNPNLPAVTDALKTVNIAEEAGTDVLGVVLNRKTNHDSELESSEVESMIGHPVIMDVPEHEKVQEALAVKKPVVHHAPDHHVSERFKGVAAEVAGIDYEPDLSKKGFLSKLLGNLR